MPREYVRFMIDCAIPKEDWIALTDLQRARIRNDILNIKTKSIKVNEGNSNEENTVRAKYHMCRHELEDLSCIEDDVTESNPAQMQMEEELLGASGRVKK